MLWAVLTAATDPQLEIARLTTRATILAALITGVAAVAAAWFSRSAARRSGDSLSTARAVQTTLEEHGRLLSTLVEGREEETRSRAELERRVDVVEQAQVLCAACPILRANPATS